jgi:uncharacterized protein (TIGR01777 family)
LIGKKITENLLETGFQIHYLTTGKSKTNILQGATGFYWNPEQNQIDLKCFYGVDTIIHLAGSTVSKRWTKSYKEKIYSSRINSSKLLLKGIEDLNGEHQIKHLVSASAIGVYPSDFNDYFDEEAEVSRTTFMERVVVDWENETDSFSSEGISIAKLRIGLVLSESGGVLGTLKLPTYFGLGAAFGSGKQGQSWIHMNDLVGIFLKAVEDQWEGVFNAVAPNPVTQSEFIASLSRALKRPYFLPPIPAFLIRIGAGEMSDLVLDSHWISSQKVIDKGYSFQYTDIQKALDDLIK